jgi:hypothetical protein
MFFDKVVRVIEAEQREKTEILAQVLDGDTVKR